MAGLNNGLADANAQAQREVLMAQASAQSGSVYSGGAGSVVGGGGGQPMRTGNANASLPGIDRDAYFAQQREAANELMGVVGIDGKLYRSDVAKPSKGTVRVPAPEARGSRSNNQRESAFPPAR